MIPKLIGGIAGFATLLYSIFIYVTAWPHFSIPSKIFLGLFGLGVLVFVSIFVFFLLQAVWEKIWRWLRSR